MKSSDEPLGDTANTIAMIIVGVLFLLLPFIIMSLPSSESSGGTSEESARYEEYRSEQLQSEYNELEACIDQMDRDVERYGEWVINTYDCTN